MTEQDKQPCLGGCGTLMPPGQKCIPCATAAVDAWKAKQRGGETAEETVPSRVGYG